MHRPPQFKWIALAIWPQLSNLKCFATASIIKCRHGLKLAKPIRGLGYPKKTAGIERANVPKSQQSQWVQRVARHVKWRKNRIRMFLRTLCLSHVESLHRAFIHPDIRVVHIQYLRNFARVDLRLKYGACLFGKKYRGYTKQMPFVLNSPVAPSYCPYSIYGTKFCYKIDCAKYKLWASKIFR